MMISLGLGKFGLLELQKKAANFARDCFERHDLHKDQPAELDDKTPRFLKTRDGYRISALLLPEDIGMGFPSSVSLMAESMVSSVWAMAAILGSTFGALLLLTIPVLSFAYFGSRSLSKWSAPALFLVFVAGIFFPPVWLLPAFFYILRPFTDFLALEKTLFEKRRHQGSTFAAESNPIYERMLDAHIPAREAQRVAVLADKSPVFEIGVATGTLTDVGDGYAPDKGMVIQISANDLATSLWVWGETGTGKTSAILRKMVKWWANSKEGGLAVFDGKNDLPHEAKAVPGYILIAPGETPYGLIAGLDAVTIANSIRNAMDKTPHPFFSPSSQTLILNAGILLQQANKANPIDFPWTLKAIRSICSDGNALAKALSEVKASGTFDGAAATLLNEAVFYFEIRFKNFDKETLANIQSTVESWLSPIFEHEELYQWAASTEGVDPTKVCEGAFIGVSTPEYKYGKAGVAVQTLIKARIYRAIQLRGSGWKQIKGQTTVLMMMDEAQELIGEAEMAMTAVSRSLGLRFVMASQHIDGIIAKMGKDAAKAMLKNFRSMICLTSSAETIEYMSERMGNILRRTPQAGIGGIAFDVIPKQIIESGGALGAISESAGVMNTVMRQSAMPINVSTKIINAKTGMVADVSEMAGKIEQNNRNTMLTVQANYAIEEGRVLSQRECDIFLKTPFSAIADVLRGNVPRRDIVILKPEFA